MKNLLCLFCLNLFTSVLFSQSGPNQSIDYSHTNYVRYHNLRKLLRENFVVNNLNPGGGNPFNVEPNACTRTTNYDQNGVSNTLAINGNYEAGQFCQSIENPSLSPDAAAFDQNLQDPTAREDGCGVVGMGGYHQTFGNYMCVLAM